MENRAIMEKLSFEQFLGEIDANDRAFVQELHHYLLDNGCKATFEEKKTSLLGSYKYIKSKRSVINLLLKKQGLLVRIYGENTGKYFDFLQTLPEEMVQAIARASECKRLVYNTCSPKCSGYDVTIGGDRYQKCKYGGFEFLVAERNNPSIKSFVVHEMRERLTV